jgi:hypothetical protein
VGVDWRSPVTFAELERMPDSSRRYELRHGELVEVALPQHGEKPGFRPGPGDEYWIAHGALVSRERWVAIPDDGYMEVAPDRLSVRCAGRLRLLTQSGVSGPSMDLHRMVNL